MEHAYQKGLKSLISASRSLQASDGPGTKLHVAMRKIIDHTIPSDWEFEGITRDEALILCDGLESLDDDTGVNGSN